MFFRTPLLWSTLFQVQVTEFQLPDTVRNYFTSAFQAFYTRTTSSHSKTLKSLNLSVKKLICNEVVRCQPASLQRKLFHTSSFMYFTFIFSGCIMITFSEGGLKVCEYNFFQGKVVLLVIYLFIHDSFKSTIFMLNMAFDVLLGAVFVKYSKLEHSFLVI